MFPPALRQAVRRHVCLVLVLPVWLLATTGCTTVPETSDISSGVAQVATVGAAAAPRQDVLPAGYTVPAHRTARKALIVEVAGEVAEPGVLDSLVAGDCVADAVGAAGGITQWADPNHVQLIRKDPATNRPVTYTVDLEAVLFRGADAANVPLQAGDRIYVPSRKAVERIRRIGAAFSFQ